ncbi:aromatic ring-hydroxylating dioxygenase subunit alpha [Halomonas ramblicola]|uniref:aromatic ring-hydroxylating dioxygenase subunit alpha n=1 Tax=Halomonas ramblicola TaxID=747349 RepID=UPI0025B2E68D|nr:aromatic ring-hydroxylating dioxygenase subunit alpha [Halomonas ramblicola]MDN3522003.1 aromatic ring-hydroxylating dioxygenase subunit alpha [Halomonas ramblicola]
MLKAEFPRNCWYVAAWSHELDEGPLGRTILGEPLVLWCDGQGHPVALADRCCHRGAPLSMGRCVDGRLQCMYHGLKFDQSGHCIEMPGQDQVPRKARVRAYPLVQRGQWLWVWMGEPERAREADIPHTPWLDAERWPYRPGYYHYQAPAELINDNLLDFSHLSYVHEGTLGGSEAIAGTRPQVTPLPHGLRIERRVEGVPPAPNITRFTSVRGTVNRWFSYDFLLPGVLLMEFCTEPTDGGEPLMQYTCQAVTPETPHTAHYFFMGTRDFALADPAVTEAIYEGLVTAFEEDRLIIEAQYRALREQGDFAPVATVADQALIQFRRLVEQRVAEDSAKS